MAYRTTLTPILGRGADVPEDETTVEFMNMKFGELLGNTEDNRQQISILSTKYIEGMEYLLYYHEKIRNAQLLKIIASGDSTTYGYGITDTNYLIHNLCKSLLNKYGVIGVTSINAGHNSAQTTAWQSTYLANDLAQNPDLYILRWGLNDGSVAKSTRLETFTNALRGGLATIRATKTVQQLSIILMMPNSTNDPDFGRDKEWFDMIYLVIKKAARDYQCCFIDTYNYLLDSTNVIWQDAPMTDPNAHIHPLETGNAWIANLMAETVIPTIFRNYGVSNIVSTTASKTVTDTPTTYPFGVSMYRTSGAFPYDGEVYTFRSLDNILLQVNSSYMAQTTEKFAFRRGIATTGVSGAIGNNAWTGWIHVGNSEAYKTLPLQSSWINYGGDKATAQYMKDSAGNTHIKGMIKSGTITTSTVIATIDAGYRPLESFFEAVLCNGSLGIVQINPNGTIVAISILSNEWIDFGRIIFKAEQ